MRFVEITPEEFTGFAEKSSYKSFMQTTQIAKLRESNKWVAYYLGVKENDELKAATMLVAKPTFLGKSTFIAPGGPLIDFENANLVTFFTKNLRNYVKSHNGYVFQMSPYYELIERDRNGEQIPDGFNHEKALKTLKNQGFTKDAHPSQPEFMFAMDIAGRTKDQIFADLKRNTRGHVRKAEKSGVTIRELKREELPIFKKITESTSERRHFTDRPLSYYEQMYDLFHQDGQVKFMLAEVEIEGKKTPLSAAMFMLYGDEIVYLFSGSDEQYMREYNAQYLIQWDMIKYAAEHGYKRYNFYGISGLPDKSDPDYGIYDFKKGFGADYGHVIQLIGTYELPVSPLYHLHHLLSKLKHH